MKQFTSKVNKALLIDNLEQALFAATICSYAQGLGVIREASEAHGWGIDLALCAKLWKGGCIIRSGLLNSIQRAFSFNAQLPNLMVDPLISKDLNTCSGSWRKVIMQCAMTGVPCPSLTSSLAYFDSYRTKSLPANLTQAQRDFFGGHTYERIDKDGKFHCAWTESHKDIGDISQRTAGEQ